VHTQRRSASHRRQNRTYPGDDLSILDVLSLILAVPVTILYKVIFDGKAPFSATPEIEQIIQSGLPWPPVPTQANLRAKAPAPAALQDISPILVSSSRPRTHPSPKAYYSAKKRPARVFRSGGSAWVAVGTSGVGERRER
jgi:hypothetical protein